MLVFCSLSHGPLLCWPRVAWAAVANSPRVAFELISLIFNFFIFFLRTSRTGTVPLFNEGSAACAKPGCTATAEALLLCLCCYMSSKKRQTTADTRCTAVAATSFSSCLILNLNHQLTPGLAAKRSGQLESPAQQCWKLESDTAAGQ